MAATSAAWAKPVTICPSNPHYFFYKGRPLVLITSDHHYGAIIDRDYRAGKPIVDVESDYFGVGLVKPYTADDVRVEGWWFMLDGGAGFINLNGEYHRGCESGGKDTQALIVPQKRILKDFF